MKKDVLIQKSIQDIAAGFYSPGDKFESVRSLSKKYQVSHVTAHNILTELADLGILDTKDRSGHTVTINKSILKKYIHSVQDCDSPKIENILGHLIQTESRKGIIPLGTSLSLTQLIPVQEILDALPSKTSYYRESLSHYSYPPGHLGLRFQISKLISSEKKTYVPDDIVLTNGASEGIYLALQKMTNPGDSVIIHSPTFYGTVQMLKSLKLNIIEVPNAEVGFNLLQIENELNKNKKIKVGIFQTNFPSPSGNKISEKTKKALVNLLKKNSGYIIEDDTYSHLGFSSKRSSNLKDYDKKDEIVFYCSSFSKTLGPGFRVGWLIPPKNSLDQIIKQKLSLSFSGVTNNEEIIFKLLKKRNFYLKHTNKVKKIFKTNTEIISKILTTHITSNVVIYPPKGGFSLWIKLPKNIDSFELYKQMIKKNIAISPGFIFSSKNYYRNYIRINCALEISKNVESALIVLAEKINELSNHLEY